MSAAKTGRKILIFGASADMAKPLLDLLFSNWQQCTFYLLARNVAALQPLAVAGKNKGHEVIISQYDIEQPPAIHFTGIEFCITYAGWLPDDKNAVEKSRLLNFTGIQLFVDALIKNNADTLEHIMITGSVAGVRCRPVNRAYGMAKQALHKYAIELHDKWKNKITITLVIPGFIQTKMLDGMSTPRILTLDPKRLAKSYLKWLSTKPKQVYSQPVWKAISVVLRLMPEFLVKRMKN